MEAVEKQRFRVSVRWLMIAVAVCALVLAPLAWLIRQQNERIRLEQLLANERAFAVRAQEVARVHAAEAEAWAMVAERAAHPEVGPPAAGGKRGVWAALSVNHAAFRQGEIKNLAIEFTLVNDGDTVVDSKIADSRIVVNGKDLADSGFILGNGPRDARFNALPPGDRLRFSYALGEQFPEPGVYQVSWRGKQFRSPEVVIRVLPDQAH
jgi:hypothetical protein